MLDFFLDQLMLLGGPWHVNDTEAVKEQQYGTSWKGEKCRQFAYCHTASFRWSLRHVVNSSILKPRYDSTNFRILIVTSSDESPSCTILINVAGWSFLNQHLFRLVGGKILAASMPKACSGPQESLTNVKSCSISPGDNAERRRRHLATTWLYCVHTFVH